MGWNSALGQTDGLHSEYSTRRWEFLAKERWDRILVADRPWQLDITWGRQRVRNLVSYGGWGGVLVKLTA